MKNFIYLICFVSVLNSASALVVTVEEHLPLLKPNLTILGTEFAEFLRAHPLAKDLSLSERESKASFTGMLSEDQGDGALVLYGFTDDELASLTWASKATGNMPERLKIVREGIIKLHGPPKQIEYAARMDADGSIAKVTREVYQSKLDNRCVICLMATSGGIEVYLTDDSVFERNGRINARQSYEDVVKAVGHSIPSNPDPSNIIDYLLAARSEAEQPNAAGPETLSPKVIEISPQTQMTVSPKKNPSVGQSDSVIAMPSISWLWWMSGPAVVVLVFLANAVRKSRR